MFLNYIATRIFYRFLNIYKIFTGFHASKIFSKFEGLKSHLVPSFKLQKTTHIKKQSLSFQNVVLKLRAPHEMNIWEREIQGALE